MTHFKLKRHIYKLQKSQKKNISHRNCDFLFSMEKNSLFSIYKIFSKRNFPIELSLFNFLWETKCIFWYFTRTFPENIPIETHLFTFLWEKSLQKEKNLLLKQQFYHFADIFCLYSLFFCFRRYNIAKTKVLCRHNALLCFSNRPNFTGKAKFTKNGSIRL